MTEIAERLTSILKSSLSVRGVVTVLVVFGVVWLASGWRLRGRFLAGWLAVPVLVAIASFSIAGQEHLFPDRSFEGPHLIRVGDGDAITLTDFVGVTIGGVACLLALILLWRRLRPMIATD